MAEFIFIRRKKIPFKYTVISAVPTLLYGIGYVANILLNGVGEGHASNDWYGFTLWGLDKMPLVLAIMLLATFLIGLAIRVASNRVALRRVAG